MTSVLEAPPVEEQKLAEIICWPFRTKSPSQYQRIDEGWDLQTAVGADVVAILSGTLHYACNPATDGSGFGCPYPWVELDTPYTVNGRTYVAYYLGHTHPVVADGSHVTQGQTVAITTYPGGGGAPPGWLECGWWGPGGPVGKGTGWTQAGQDMHDALVNAAPFGPSPVPQGGSMLSQAIDPISNGCWTMKPDGSIYTTNGAPYLGGANNNPKLPIVGTPQAVSYWHGDGTVTGGLGYMITTEDNVGTLYYYRLARDGSSRSLGETELTNRLDAEDAA